MGIILGLCGVPGAGKTEVRKILQREHGFQVINSKIVICEMASVLTGLPPETFSNPETKDGMFNNASLREIAAFCGYVAEDLFGSTYLIEQQINNLRVLQRLKTTNFIIDSLRMKQPIKLVQGNMLHGVVEVVNNKVVERTEIFDGYNTTGVKNLYKVGNNGSLGDLKINVAKMVMYAEKNWQ